MNKPMNSEAHRNAIIAARNVVELAKIELKLVELAATALCPVKVGDVLDGKVGMSGTPCKMVVQDIRVEIKRPLQAVPTTTN